MSLVFDLDSRSPLIVVTAAGESTPADWRDGIASLVADATMPLVAAVLLDLRQADGALAVEDMGGMTSLLTRLNARFGGRVALLTTAVGHATPAALLACQADGPRCPVHWFTDEPGARSWLSRGR